MENCRSIHLIFSQTCANNTQQALHKKWRYIILFKLLRLILCVTVITMYFSSCNEQSSQSFIQVCTWKTCSVYWFNSFEFYGMLLYITTYFELYQIPFLYMIFFLLPREINIRTIISLIISKQVRNSCRIWKNEG